MPRRAGRRPLVDAVRRVATGQSLLDPAVTQRVLERIRHGVEQPRELRDLTDQERRISCGVRSSAGWDASS